MTIARKAQLLAGHSIAVRHAVGGRLYAREQWAQGGQAMARWIDVTDWTADQMLSWLGY